MAGRRTWTDEQLEAAIAASTSWAQVIKRLGLQAAGSARRGLSARAEALGLSTEHFHGQAWARGKTFQDRPKTPLEDLLVAGRRVHTMSLKMRLVGAGIKSYRCEACGISEWCGQPAPLELDHVDGDRLNNTLANLRIPCANCHAQTPTYCGKNKGRVVEQVDTPALEAGASA